MTAHYLFHHSFFFGLLRMLPMLFIMNLIAPDSMLSAAHLKVMKKVNEKDYSPIRQNSDKLERTTLDDRKFLGNRNIISPDIRFSAVQLKGMKPITEDNFSPVRENLVKLGRLLFYDPILSGNRNISCGTCHHHKHHSTDGLSLGVGEGGSGIGLERNTGMGDSRIKKRIPRNSPALFNLGALEIRMMFHDGRLSLGDQYENGFNSPAEEWLVKGLNNLLAAQAVLPLVGESEMAGNSGENQVAGAIYDRIDMGWPILAKRVRVIPEYATLFVATYEDVTDYSQVSISHIANAIGDFINFEWRSYDSPFDFYLNGDDQALSPNQKRGMKLFYGKAQCAECHQGVFFTDQKFYALALPQFGPGRTRVFDPYVRDVGRMAETDRLEDAYRFRTPGLRNVALTGPYGHNGAYATLEGIIRHHLDPLGSLANWDPAQVILPKAEWLNGIDFVVFEDRFERERLKSRLDIQPLDLTKAEVADLVIFMHALTGTESIWGRLGHPDKVPSGLPVD